MYPGEYTQPIPRVTNLQIPVVASFVTGRLRAQEMVSGAATGYIFGGSGYADNTTVAIVENVGLTSFTVQLQETTDRTVSGPRTVIAGPLTVVPDGRKTVTFIPTQQYLEVKSTSGDGQLRLQLQSKIRWDVLGFAKDDPFYPTTRVVFPSHLSDPSP